MVRFFKALYLSLQTLLWISRDSLKDCNISTLIDQWSLDAETISGFSSWALLTRYSRSNAAHPTIQPTLHQVSLERYIPSYSVALCNNCSFHFLPHRFPLFDDDFFLLIDTGYPLWSTFVTMIVFFPFRQKLFRPSSSGDTSWSAFFHVWYFIYRSYPYCSWLWKDILFSFRLTCYCSFAAFLTNCLSSPSCIIWNFMRKPSTASKSSAEMSISVIIYKTQRVGQLPTWNMW